MYIFEFCKWPQWISFDRSQEAIVINQYIMILVAEDAFYYDWCKCRGWEIDNNSFLWNEFCDKSIGSHILGDFVICEILWHTNNSSLETPVLMSKHCIRGCQMSDEWFHNFKTHLNLRKLIL